MVEALADFIGVEAEYLTSDAGIVIMLVIIASLVYVVFKCLFTWFSGLFGK